MTDASPTIMRFDHPRWEEFRELLSGPAGCNFRQEIPDDFRSTKWNCIHDHTHTRTILKSLGFDDQSIDASIDFLCACGGCCDCEVIWNVPSKEESWRSSPDQGFW